MRVPVWEPGCAGFVSGEPACVSDVLAPCGSVGAPQPGGVLGLAGGGVGSVGGAERGGHAHTDLEGQAERAPGQQDHGPGEEHQPELLLPAQRLPRRPQRIKKPRQALKREELSRDRRRRRERKPQYQPD